MIVIVVVIRLKVLVVAVVLVLVIGYGNSVLHLHLHLTVAIGQVLVLHSDPMVFKVRIDHGSCRSESDRLRCPPHQERVLVLVEWMHHGGRLFRVGQPCCLLCNFTSHYRGNDGVWCGAATS